MLSCNLQFYGYTWDGYLMYLTGKKGLFLVYRGKIGENDIVKMQELLYITYVDSLDSFNNCKIIDKMRASIKPNERLFFSYAVLDNLKITESIIDCLVKFAHPRFNDEGEFHSIRIICSGNCAFLPSEILL